MCIRDRLPSAQNSKTISHSNTDMPGMFSEVALREDERIGFAHLGDGDGRDARLQGPVHRLDIKTMNRSLQACIPPVSVAQVSKTDPLIFPESDLGKHTGHVSVGMADGLRVLSRR